MAEVAAKKPNIILMNCDDLGYGDLGCYGSSVNQTAALDRMAREGVRFTDFYVASSVCSPSRGALMTGCYPPRIGFGTFEGRHVLFPGQGVGLNPSEVTIAKLLKNSGYRTMHIGKWHCGDQPEFLPTRHGFDEYYGLPYSNDMGRQKNQYGMNNLPPLPLLHNEEVIQEQPDQASLTERYVEKAVRFIRDSRHQPFFLYFAHMHVHLPLLAAERFIKQSRNGPYGAMVECIDWSMEVLMRELKRLGLDEQTLVIFTSDNGSRGDNGGSNAPLRGSKFNTWEGGLRVPCIMRWPGMIPSGSVSKGLATTMDLYPTLAKLAGAEVPNDRRIDGLDITELLLQPAAESPRDSFFYYMQNTLHAVRDGRWKLHVRRQDAACAELYDLEQDPGETNNVYSAHPDVVARLEKLLEDCRKDLGDEALGIKGTHIRPSGTVANPAPLTEYDESHPYMVSMYDGLCG